LGLGPLNLFHLCLCTLLFCLPTTLSMQHRRLALFGAIRSRLPTRNITTGNALAFSYQRTAEDKTKSARLRTTASTTETNFKHLRRTPNYLPAPRQCTPKGTADPNPMSPNTQREAPMLLGTQPWDSDLISVCWPLSGGRSGSGPEAQPLPGRAPGGPGDPPTHHRPPSA
jgi:hypothetical protein